MDLSELFRSENEARQIADSKVAPEQVALKPGDFCVRVAHGITIYSEILDAANLLLNGRQVNDLDEDELEEYQDVLDSYKEEALKHYRFTRSYSYLCPQGELGDIHISTVHRIITKEEFLAAQCKGWVA